MLPKISRDSLRRTWNRFRLARVAKWLLFIGLVAYVAGKVRHEPPMTALFNLPAQVFKALPMILQVVFIMFIAVGQFVAIFLFLSKGGVDVYMPAAAIGGDDGFHVQRLRRP